MKNFLKSLVNILESLNKARAATALSRQGKFEKAKQLMIAD